MVRNITLSAEASLIEKARQRAHDEGRELNQVFRDWLRRYVTADAGSTYDNVMKRLTHTKTRRRFSRDELNERQVLP
jgi:hypothetical protein